MTAIKKNNKNGFTLAELLIVIAIISVLVSIAIPTFTSVLKTARQRVDDANARALASAISVCLLTEEIRIAPSKGDEELFQINLLKNSPDKIRFAGLGSGFEYMKSDGKWAKVNGDVALTHEAAKYITDKIDVQELVKEYYLVRVAISKQGIKYIEVSYNNQGGQKDRVIYGSK